MGEEVTGVGVCPVGCRLTLPLWYPEGGLAFLVAGFFLPYQCFIAPIPPPALAERSSPPGKGEIFLFSYARGFAPCIPRAEPEATRE